MSKTGLYSFWKILRESVKKRDIKRINYDGLVRLKDKDGFEYCPLTYCDFVKNGAKRHISCFRDSALCLNIDYENAIRIASSADGGTGKTRAKLLKTLKLKENK